MKTVAAERSTYTWMWEARVEVSRDGSLFGTERHESSVGRETYYAQASSAARAWVAEQLARQSDTFKVVDATTRVWLGED